MDDYGGSTGSQSGQGAQAQQGGEDSGAYGSTGQSSYVAAQAYTSQAAGYTSAAAYQSSVWSSVPATAAKTSATQTNSPFPTSSSSASGISSSQRTSIIAGVAGSVGALVLISLLAILLCKRRRAKKAARNGTAPPVSYDGLNTAFTGVPFLRNGVHPNGPGHHPPPPMAADTSYQGASAYMRGGHAGSPEAASRENATETDRFLNNYEDVQLHSEALNKQTSSDPFLTPATTPRDPFTDQNRLSVISRDMPSEPPTPRPAPPVRHDTMGFPLDDDDTTYIGPDGQEHHLGSARNSLAQPIIMAPAPIRPIAHENLERGIWETQQLMSNNQTSPQDLANVSPLQRTYTSNSDNSLSPALARHLGRDALQRAPSNNSDNFSIAPVQQVQRVATDGTYVVSPLSPNEGREWTPVPTNQNLSIVQRNTSQRTESSFAPSVISDTELDRLGVGRRT